jgi:hypothetical protein
MLARLLGASLEFISFLTRIRAAKVFIYVITESPRNLIPSIGSVEAAPERP